MRLSVPNSSATYITNVLRTSRSNLAGGVTVSNDHYEEVDMDVEETDESLVISDGEDGEVSTEPSLTSEDAEMDHSSEVDETGDSSDLPQPNNADSEVEAEMEEEHDESDDEAGDDDDDDGNEDDEGDEQYSVSLLDTTQHGDDDIHIVTTIPLR